MTWKHLFSRSLSANPTRLHFAAHSHHLWPDASHAGHLAAWDDAAKYADHKWDRIMGPIWAQAQGHIAGELNLPDPTTISFAPNTHDFLVRIMSALPNRPVRVLATHGEFHSFRRQMARWVENGDALLETAPPDMLVTRARDGQYDLIFASQILFNSGAILPDIRALGALSKPDGPWVVIDGYHGFMAIQTDLSGISDHVFYLAGGYKYAMAGEGVCFLHAPRGFAPRPVITGWYAEFDDLSLPPGSTGYAKDGARFLGSTFDPSGLYRFNHVRHMLDSEGLTTDKISAHVAVLQQVFLDGVSGEHLGGWTLLNPIDHGPHARFLAFRTEHAAAIYAYLNSHDVVTDIRGDVLRIGFAIYHDHGDVERLVSIINGFRPAS